MAKTQWGLLLIAFIASTASLALLIISFVTNYWIIAEAQNPPDRNSIFNYGLFSGSMTRWPANTETDFQLAVVCLFEENACIYSCQNTPELRLDEIHRLLTGEPLFNCAFNTRILTEHTMNNGINKSVVLSVRQSTISDSCIDPGLWLTTVIFLGVSVLFAFLSALFSLVNIIYNPIEPILGILGLYVWNGIAIGSTFIALIVWGVLYGVQLGENIAVTDTLRPDVNVSSSGLASLGFSYWILIGPMVLHILGIAVVLYRTHIISLEPKAPTLTVEKSNYDGILLY